MRRRPGRAVEPLWGTLARLFNGVEPQVARPRPAMTPAIFGITNGTLNLFVSLLILSLVAMWLALIYRAFVDAERRIEDPVLVRVLPLWAIFPFVGYWIYSIIRPPEYLEDVREREVETKSAEARLAMMQNRTCSNCGYEVETSYLRCPSCLRKLKKPCESCSKPLDPRWRVCPFCEAEVEREAPAEAPVRRAKRKAEPAGKRPAASRPRVAESEPERVTPSAAERQKRSLSSVRTEEPETADSEAAEERLSAAAAVGPKREASGSSNSKEAETQKAEKQSAAAKRSAARRTAGSKKTSASRSSRKSKK